MRAAIAREVARREFEEADRIVLEGIDAERDDQRIGSVSVDVFSPRRAPGSRLPVRRPRRHRIVDVASFAPAFAVFVGEAEEIGIGVFRLAVQRDEQHIVAPVEDVLGAVAVMKVDIEYGDPPGSLVEKHLRGDRRVVEEAIASVHVVGA